MDMEQWLAQLMARHGQAVERLAADMAEEDDDADPVRFLAYDTANFVYAFLLATGNNATPTDRKLRDEVQDAVLAVLERHGVTAAHWQSS